jgi:hypothetical protein
VVPKIRRLSLHRHVEKKKLETIKGVVDHIKFIAIARVPRKGESALFREERRGEVFVESDATQCRLCGSLLSQMSWGSAAAGRTIEDRFGGCSCMQRSWRRGSSQGTFVDTSDPDRMQSKD